MKTALKIILFGGLILGSFYTVYYLWSKEQVDPVVYETEQASTQTIIKKSVATGSVVPRKEVDIKPQVSGIVKELFVEAGDIVEAGALIARVQIIPNMVNLNNAENRVNRARISLADAEEQYKRNLKLKDSGVISVAEFLPFQTAKNNASEELEAAESNMQLIKEGASRRSGRSSNTLIRSTIDGMVLDVPIEEGNSVIESNTFNEGTTIASVADMGNMIFEGYVDESEVNKIQPNMDLILKIGAIEDLTFNAKLEYISPKGETIDGAIQFEIRAALAAPDSQSTFIRAGYSANADIVLARRDSVLALNEGLLQFNEEGNPFVEVETGDQQFEAREVSLGLSDGIFVEILSGITLEDKIKQPNTNLQQGGGGGHGY